MIDFQYLRHFVLCIENIEDVKDALVAIINEMENEAEQK